MHLPWAAQEVFLQVEAAVKPQVLKFKFLILVTKLVRSAEKQDSRCSLLQRQMNQEWGQHRQNISNNPTLWFPECCSWSPLHVRSQNCAEPQWSWQGVDPAGREVGQIHWGPTEMESRGRATLGAKNPLWLLEILQSQQTGMLPKPIASARTHFYGTSSDRFCSHTINNAPSLQVRWNVVLLKLIALTQLIVAEALFQHVKISIDVFWV